jgi:RNA polymerase sigma factor (sigma-70 family)
VRLIEEKMRKRRLGSVYDAEADELAAYCREWFPRLVGLLSLYCGSLGVAEELSQETLIRVCRDWRRLRTMGDPDAWIKRVALNLAHSHFRRRKAERRALARVDISNSTEATDHDLRMVVLAGIAALPSREKAAVILRFYEDMTIPEVALVLDCPEGTVKSLIHRGKKRLERKLRSSLETGVMANAG